MAHVCVTMTSMTFQRYNCVHGPSGTKHTGHYANGFIAIVGISAALNPISGISTHFTGFLQYHLFIIAADSVASLVRGEGNPPMTSLVRFPTKKHDAEHWCFLFHSLNYPLNNRWVAGDTMTPLTVIMRSTTLTVVHWATQKKPVTTGRSRETWALFYFALFCCGNIVSPSGFRWCIYLHSSGLFHQHWVSYD